MKLADKILKLLREKNNSLSISDIARELKAGYSNVHKAVEKLLEAGLVEEYRPNPKIRLIYLKKEEDE